MRSPDFYESVWAAAYAAAHVSGKRGATGAAADANLAVEALRLQERLGAPQIVEREELLRTIRTESTK